MSIAASTRPGGRATGAGRSVADPPNKRREVRRLPDLCGVEIPYCDLWPWLLLFAFGCGLVGAAAPGTLGWYFHAWLFCAAGVVHELPGRVHCGCGFGCGFCGSIVRPARLITRAPKPLMLLTAMLVAVFVPAIVMVSMSMVAAVPSRAVPPHTWAAAGSVIVLSVNPAPIRHSRRLLPTIRSVLCVLPSLKVMVTLPTTVWSYQR